MADGQRPIGAKPRQNIPESKKNEEWYKRNVYYGLGVFNNEANSAQRRLMQRNLNIYQGNLDTSEFNYLLYPEGTADQTLTVQAVFKNYQLAQPLMQSRINQFLSQKLSFSVDIVNREAVLKKEERMASIMGEKIAKGLIAQMSRETGIEIPVEEQSLGLPDDLRKLQTMKIREIEEDAILNGLHYVNSRYNLKNKFRKGLENLLLYNAVLFRNRRLNNDPVPDVINPIDTALFMQTDDDQANWGDGFITATWKSVSDVLDNYELDDKKVDKIEQLTSIGMSDFNNLYWNNGEGWYQNYGMDFFYRNIGQDNAKVLVAEMEWRSIIKMYIKKSKNKFDDDSYFYKKITEEEYEKLDKKEQGEYRSIPYSDLRKATLIGHDMVVEKGRVKFQTRREQYGYGRVPLSICGVQKSPLMAVMTILAPLQIEYCIVWFHIERLLGQSGGKMIEMWLHNKPSGWTNEKWIFYAKNKGVNFREFKEGDDLAPQPSMSQGVDLGMSSSFQYLIQYAMLIENTAQKLIGTNAAAQGSLSGNEAVGTTQANLMQAQNMAVGIYYDLNVAIEQVLNDMADKMKMWWKEGDVKVWQTDVENISFTVTGDLPNNDYGVFVQNNAIDEQKMMKYEAMANQALASGGAEYMDYIMEMTDAENSSEAKAIIKKGMQSVRDMQKQMQDRQMQIQEQGVAEQKRANDLKDKELEIKATVPIEVAQIQAGAKTDMKQREIEHDENREEIRNATEQENLAFKESMGVLKGGKKSG